MNPLIATAAAAVLFALVHVFIGRLKFLDVLPRSRWLSFAGGVAVAYVFLHILPELSEHRETFAEELGVSSAVAEARVYLLALVGLSLFYGLERAVKLSRRANDADRVESEILWLHVASYGLYNVLIGYLLLHREDTGMWSLVTYASAISLHFVTTDFGLRQDQKSQYDHAGRWVLAAAVIIGWVLGVFASLSEVAIGSLFALLAGGIVLNVLKEELPEERKSRFWPFAIGAAGYAALQLVGA